MNRMPRPLLMATIASVVAVTGASALGVAANAAPAVSHQHKVAKDSEPFWAASGNSFASLLQVGNTIQSAKSALTEVGCGAAQTKSVAATPDITLPGLGTLGSITSNTATQKMPLGDVKTVSTARATGLSLLGGLIQAQALVSTAWAGHDGTTSAGGSTSLIGLTVGGVPVPTSPKPNTTINLLGIGTLTLNLQHKIRHDGILTERVTALNLRITKSLPKLPAGTLLILGHSGASVEKLTTQPLGGSADGDQAIVPGILDSGQTFRNYLPCNGTGGKTITNSGAGINLGKILTTGAVKTTVRGVTADGSPKSVTSATIASVNLLGGMVKADVIKARAAVTQVEGQNKFIKSSDGSELIGLTIAGKHFNKAIAPNTKFNLAGIGTLWLDRVQKGAHEVDVHMIELDLSTGVDGYAKGTVITVADANARIH